MKDIIFRLLYQLAKRIPSPGLPVLLYHSISEKNWPHAVNPKEFNKQIEWLASRYNCVSTRDIEYWVRYKKSLPENALAITFDDGYRDNLKVAFPILQKYHFTATIFVSGNLAANIKNRGNNFKLLTRHDLKFLLQHGWLIESHSYSHEKLTRIPGDTLEREIEKSGVALEKVLGKKIESIAYPKGRYNANVMLTAQKHFSAAWTISPRFVRQGENLFSLPRIEVKKDTTLSVFQAHLTPILELMQKVKKGFDGRV